MPCADSSSLQRKKIGPSDFKSQLDKNYDGEWSYILAITLVVFTATDDCPRIVR